MLISKPCTSVILKKTVDSWEVKYPIWMQPVYQIHPHQSNLSDTMNNYNSKVQIHFDFFQRLQFEKDSGIYKFMIIYMVYVLYIYID